MKNVFNENDLKVLSLDNLFPILYDERKKILIDIINRWNINWEDMLEFRKIIEEAKKYDLEVQDSKLSYYYSYVWLAPDPIAPMIKSEINKFIAVINGIIMI